MKTFVKISLGFRLKSILLLPKQSLEENNWEACKRFYERINNSVSVSRIKNKLRLTAYIKKSTYQCMVHQEYKRELSGARICITNCSIYFEPK